MSSFSTGVAIFFRLLDTNQQLTRSVHPNGRDVTIGNSYSHQDDYVVLDEDDNVIGIYPRDFVSAILPLETVGPAANVNN